MRLQVFLLRAVMGAVFGVLLARMFFPSAGYWAMGAIAVFLVFFAYSFEYIHKGRGR
jgi:hypothetical protein